MNGSSATEKNENVVVGFGVGVTGLMILYSILADLFLLDRTGCRNLFLVSLGITSIGLVARWLRFRRLGVAVSINSFEFVRSNPNGTLYWLLCLAVLGAYSCRELRIGSFAVGIVGIIAAMSSMLVLTVALIRAPGGLAGK